MQWQIYRVRQLLVGIVIVTISGCAGTTQTAGKWWKPDWFDGNSRAVRTAGRFWEPDWLDGNSRAIAVVPKNLDKPYPGLLSLRSRTRATGTAEGAAIGAGGGALTGLYVGCLAGPAGCVVGVGVVAGALAGIGAVAGAVAGTETTIDRSTHDFSSLKGASESTGQDLANRRPELSVSREIVSLLRARTDHDVQLKTYQGTAEEFVPNEPLDELVEIRLERFELIMDGEFDGSNDDPQITLLISVSATIYSMSEGKFVKSWGDWGKWEYRASSHRFSKLIAEDGRLLDREIEHAAKELAEHITR